MNQCSRIWKGLKKVKAIVFTFFLGFMLACNPSTEVRSPLLRQVFPTEKNGDFQEVRAGMSMDSIPGLESGDPKHQDRWGLAYQRYLGEGRNFTVDYYRDRRDTNQLKSIVVNLSLRDEAEALHLFQEMEAWLRDRRLLGVPEGTFGDSRWLNQKPDGSQLETRIRLLPDGVSISLQYVYLQPVMIMNEEHTIE